MTDPTDFNALIPELAAWNEGRGVSAREWIGMSGTYELAVGYSLVFWPRFIAFDGYVFREDAFNAENVRGFERATNGDRQAVEAVVNHIHIADIHYNLDVTEAQIHYLMKTLKQIWELKLRADFPDRRFIVHAVEEPGLDLIDYELTFWQAP